MAEKRMIYDGELVVEGDNAYRKEPHTFYKPGAGEVIAGYDYYRVMDRPTFMKLLEIWGHGDDKK